MVYRESYIDLVVIQAQYGTLGSQETDGTHVDLYSLLPLTLFEGGALGGHLQTT